MRKFFFSLLFAVLFSLCFTSSIHAAAKTYYVAGDVGLDSYTAAQATNSATPWLTIQKAADNVAAGDTVNVKGNISYTGSNTCTYGNAVVCFRISGSAGNYITFQPWANTGVPVIDVSGQSFGFTSIGFNYIIISGFEIKNGSVGYGTGIGTFFSNHINIINNSIHGMRSFGMGLIINNGSYINIFNNTIYDNIGIIGGGIHFDSVAPTNTLVRNNLIINNTVAFSGYWVGASSTVSNNDVWGNLTGNGTYVISANDISLDPLFVNGSGGNLALQPTSPAINAGVDLTANSVTTDILGHARPKAGAYDIGAYEDTNYYVAGDTGNNSNVGSSTSPWLTIQKAAITIIAGDTVNVKGGLSYSATTCVGGVVCPSNSGTSTNYITYQAWNGTGTPIVVKDGLIYGFRIDTKSYIKISGFKITGTAGSGTNAGISLATSSNIIISNNVIYNIIDGYGIDGGLFITTPNTNILNNTIANNGFTGIRMGFAAGGESTAQIKNNIIVGSAADGGIAQYIMGSQPDISNNLVWNNSPSNYVVWSAGTGGISVDPLFIDSSSGNLALQKSSPAINAGTTLSDVTNDILKVTRPQGSAYDIGAYEYYDIPVNLVDFPSNPTALKNPVITGTATTISGATISNISYSVNGGAWSSSGVTGTNSFSIIIPYLPDGTYTVRVRATDSYGNITDSSLYGTTTFVLDSVVKEKSIPECTIPKPESTPVITSVSKISSTEVKLTFKDTSTNIDGYFVEYGTSPNSFQYATQIGGKGTTTYTVKSLVPGKTYYFRIRNGNGCTTGSWSGTVSTNGSKNTNSNYQITNKPKTPNQTVNNLIINHTLPTATPTSNSIIPETSQLQTILTRICNFFKEIFHF